jgi:hypothetical protein
MVETLRIAERPSSSTTMVSLGQPRRFAGLNPLPQSITSDDSGPASVGKGISLGVRLERRIQRLISQQVSAFQCLHLSPDPAISVAAIETEITLCSLTTLQ